MQGDGTFVNHRVDYVITSRRPSLHDTPGAVAGQVHTRIAGCELSTVSGEIADLLRLEQDTKVQRLIRISYLNDVVFGCAVEWVPLEVADNLDVGLRAIPCLDHILRGRGHHPVRVWCRIGLDFPDESVADQLELDRPTQTWVMESLTRDRNTRQPLLASRTWTRPDMIRMVLELDDDSST